MKVKISKNGEGSNSYNIVLMDATGGEVLAIRNALAVYQTSSVSQDILSLLEREMGKYSVLRELPKM